MNEQIEFDPNAPSKSPRVDALQAVTCAYNPLEILAIELEYENAQLREALETLLASVNGNRVTVGDCNMARNALEAV